MLRIGITADDFHVSADALGRTVAALLGIGRSAVYLLQHCEVRAKHALRIVGEQMLLPLIVYVDPRTAKPDLMYEAFKQNLDAIKNDVRRHAIEKRSYDLNNIYNATLPLFDYDFSQVAEDAMMTGEYDDTYDPDDIPDPEPTKK